MSIIQKEVIKNFNYTKGKITLRVSVDVNSETQLNDLLEICENLVEELKQEITKFK